MCHGPFKTVPGIAAEGSAMWMTLVSAFPTLPRDTGYQPEPVTKHEVGSGPGTAVTVMTLNAGGVKIDEITHHGHPLNVL